MVSDFVQQLFQPKSADARKVQPLNTHSVLIDQYIDNPSQAVCRHKELVAQVILQSFGLPGEIVECHI